MGLRKAGRLSRRRRRLEFSWFSPYRANIVRFWNTVDHPIQRDRPQAGSRVGSAPPRAIGGILRALHGSLKGNQERPLRRVVGFHTEWRGQMRKTSLIGAGLIAAATFVTPAVAQQAIQEPGTMGQFYPDSDYLTGGYGVRGTPGPEFYFRHGYAPGAATQIPYGVGV